VLRLRLQLGDHGVAIVYDDVTGLGRQSCERNQAVYVGPLCRPLDWNCAQEQSLHSGDRGSRFDREGAKSSRDLTCAR
jgi:hypothetical protein